MGRAYAPNTQKYLRLICWPHTEAKQKIEVDATKKLNFFYYKLKTVLPYEDTRPSKMMMSKKGKIMFMYNMQMIIKRKELSRKHEHKRKKEISVRVLLFIAYVKRTWIFNNLRIILILVSFREFLILQQSSCFLV